MSDTRFQELTIITRVIPRKAKVEKRIFEMCKGSS